jgi:predicted amidohydrolase YtcJ
MEGTTMTARRQLVWIAVVATIGGLAVGSAQQTADTILYNGKILTVDAQASTAQALAVRGDRIAAVGTDADVLKLAGPDTLKIDLKGRTVTPGFINTHVHLESIRGYGRELGAVKNREFPLNVRGAKTAAEVVEQIRNVIAAFKIPPGEWLYFQPNWTGNQVDLVYGLMNAKELDKGAPNNPIVVRTASSIENQSLVNGVAIKELWRKYGDYIERYGRYWVDSSGQPNGHLEPPASRLVWEDQEFAAKGLLPKKEDVAPYFRKNLIEDYVSLGITTLSGALNTSTVEAYQLLDSRGEMPLRYAYGAMSGFHPGADMSKYKLGGGSPNVFVASLSARATDGGGGRSCSSLTKDTKAILAAAGQGDSSDMNRVSAEWFPRGQCTLDIEYTGGGGKGARGARISANYYKEWYRDLAYNGLRSSNSHVAGDRSVTLMIDEWAAIDREKPGSVKGWSFDHCNMVSPKDIPRAAKLQLMFSCKPSNAVASDPMRGARSPLVAYGPDVLHQYAAPFKSMIDAGINVSMEEEGSPWWLGIETLVTRKDPRGQVWGPKERVDRQTALKIATQNGANYILKSKELGSLEAGKLADIVVLDRDYMTIPEEDIRNIRPVVTMMGGKFQFVRTDFSTEYNVKPAGAEISTHDELMKRRPQEGADTTER